MRKLITIFSLLVTFLYSQENKITISDDMKEIIKSLPAIPEQKTINEMGLDGNNNVDKSKKELLKDEYKKFQFAIEQINDKAYKKLAVDNYNEGINKLSSQDNITIFYFLSNEQNEEKIRSFMNHVDVINSHFPNVKGKIFLNNYPDNLIEDYKSSINTQVIPYEKESAKGFFRLLENGEYFYKVKDIVGMIPEEKYQDIFSYIKKDGTESKIIINLKVDSNTKLKIIGDTIVDSMVPFMKNLREKNIKSSNVKFHIHPWAFKSLNLKVVPAYVFSICDNDNFKFRDCENKFIVKGNISLEYFMKLISEKDKSYSKYYDSFKEGKNVAP